jgi:hypothetical protein
MTELVFDSPLARKYILCSIVGTKLKCIKNNDNRKITEGRIYVVIEDFFTYGVILNDMGNKIPVHVDYFDIYEG